MNLRDLRRGGQLAGWRDRRLGHAGLSASGIRRSGRRRGLVPEGGGTAARGEDVELARALVAWGSNGSQMARGSNGRAW